MTLKEVKTMKSQNHRAAFYLCASIILLFALAFAATPASAQSGGLNVLSISQTDYSWSDKVQEDAWILLVTQSSQGERIYGIFDKEDITGKDPITGEEGFATHDIEITMRPISTTCNYRIEPQDGEYIYGVLLYKEVCKFSYEPWDWGVRCNWYGSEKDVPSWQQQCEDEDGIFRANKDYFAGYESGAEVSCFYLYPVGTHGVLQTPTFDFSTEAIVTKTGPEQETISTVISNHDKATYLGTYGYIEWVGSLSSGESCPETAVVPYATYIQDSSGWERWELTSRRGYEDYRGYYQWGWESCLNDIQNKNAEPEICRNKLNQLRDSALKYEPLTGTNVENAGIDYTEGGNIVRANIKPGAISYPTYKLILPASWLGIYVPKPEPSITDVRSEWSISTSQGKFRADVKNVGDEGGDFTYGLTCQSPAYAIEPERSAHWEKGEEKTIEFSVTGAVKEETIATCKVYVYATKYPDVRREITETITITPISTSSSTDAGKTTPSQDTDGVERPFTSTSFLYLILGLLFLGTIIAIVFFKRRGKGGSSKTDASKPAESEDTEKKRPSSSSAKWIAAIIILILILGLGFFVVTSLKQPEVSLKSVSVKGFESINLLIVEIPTEVIFSVVLEVYNPNFLGATVTDVEYDLYVNDIHVGEGSLPRSVTIHANDRTNVETEISVSLSSSIQALVTTVQQKSAIAKVVGDVYIRLVAE